MTHNLCLGIFIDQSAATKYSKKISPRTLHSKHNYLFSWEIGRENVQGLGANQIGACIMDGPKLIRNMSEISEVSKVSELGPKFEYCFYRNIANF